MGATEVRLKTNFAPDLNWRGVTHRGLLQLFSLVNNSQMIKVSSETDGNEKKLRIWIVVL